MPELPDLQAFSLNLSGKLSGKRLEKLHAINKGKLKNSENDLKKALIGSTLTSVYRDGKELHFAFDNGNVLALHLMLRGQLVYFDGHNDHKHTVLELLFEKGVGLAMTDIMKQATPTLNPEPSEAPDALSEEADFNFLKEALGRSKTTIKKLLTNQDVLRGIGNAYVDEILWDARISPFAVCSKIPDEAIHKLVTSIRSVFERAEKQILKTAPDIIGGEIRDFLVIHNPERTHSPTGGTILMDETGGRKTYYTKEQVVWK